MFNFLFRKNKPIFDRKRPDFYQDIVTKEEYALILKLSEKECERIGPITSIQAGTIKVANPEKKEEIFSFHLDNLVRKCNYYDRAEWGDIVQQHFARFPIDQSKAKFLSKDFEYAQPLLKVLVRSTSVLSPEMVRRVDIPHTHSFLILDYDERFHFLTEANIVEWGVPKAELFAIGLENVAVEKIDIQEVIWAETFPLFSFFSGDFSASFVLELSKNAPFSIGPFGAVVAIPTKGSAFAHPLYSATDIDFIQSFEEAFLSFYQQDEVPVSDQFYWYFERKFSAFSVQGKGKYLSIKRPSALEMLFDDKR
ncbi:MAG: hypothetical protein AAF960_23360 [Bacteroidota bacterium]